MKPIYITIRYKQVHNGYNQIYTHSISFDGLNFQHTANNQWICVSFLCHPPQGQPFFLPEKGTNRKSQVTHFEDVFSWAPKTPSHPPQAPDDHNLSSKSDSSVSMVTVIYILTLNTFHQEVEIPSKFWDNKFQDS